MEPRTLWLKPFKKKKSVGKLSGAVFFCTLLCHECCGAHTMKPKCSFDSLAHSHTFWAVELGFESGHSCKLSRWCFACRAMHQCVPSIRRMLSQKTRVQALVVGWCERSHGVFLEKQASYHHHYEQISYSCRKHLLLNISPGQPVHERLSPKNLPPSDPTRRRISRKVR